MKYKIASIIISSVLIFSSCNDFLDIKPTGSVIPETLDEYRALLTEAYSSIPTDRGLACFRSDEIKVRDNDFDYASYGEMEIWNDRPATDAATTPGWIEYYSSIFNANEVIKAYRDGKITKGSNEAIKQLAGEAYMLRAYTHFLLANLYGQPYTKSGALGTKAIPLKLNNDLEAVLSRNTVVEVYTSILDDVKNAKDLMNVKKWEEEKQLYRFNTTSISAFEARIALYMGNWQAAYDHAEEVIAAQTFLEDLNSTEAVVPTLYTSGEVITALELTPSQNVTKAAVLSQKFVDLYNSEDLRFDFYFEDPDNDGLYTSKKSGYSQFRQTFRTGEAYLTAAEAAANNNDLTNARKRILELIKKRYTPAGYTVKETAINVMSKEQLIAEILTERARELAFEGHYWYDLRRTTRPEITKIIKGETYVLKQDDPRYTIQIPQDAIDANPGLLN